VYATASDGSRPVHLASEDDGCDHILD
jgi:hypothetical protein